jgi:DNA-binding response OmpR family regulator
MRALVAEDDPDVGPDLHKALTAAGFTTELVADGKDIWARGSVEDFALVVLDLGLPGLDGLTILRRWRTEGRTFPVLVLTARGDWTEKVEGIQAGADDYLSKPFAMGELVARAHALVRRSAGYGSPVLAVGRLELDTARMTASIDGQPIKLSPLEYRFLNILAHHPGRVLTAGEIAEQLHGATDASDTNAIEALVLRLRRKIGRDVVENRRGFGYTLAES